MGIHRFLFKMKTQKLSIVAAIIFSFVFENTYAWVSAYSSDDANLSARTIENRFGRGTFDKCLKAGKFINIKQCAMIHCTVNKFYEVTLTRAVQWNGPMEYDDNCKPR